MVLVMLVYAIMISNNRVRLKHNVSRSWSNIDVLLRQRHAADAVVAWWPQRAR